MKFLFQLLLALSFMVSVVAFCGLATTLMLQEGGAVLPGWLVIFFIALAVGVYAGGVSSMPFIIMSEMFNFQVYIHTLFSNKQFNTN